MKSKIPERFSKILIRKTQKEGAYGYHFFGQPGSGSGPGPSVAAARCAAAISGLGPDPGPDPAATCATARWPLPVYFIFIGKENGHETDLEMSPRPLGTMVFEDIYIRTMGK